jgi:hypothetical protein
MKITTTPTPSTNPINQLHQPTPSTNSITQPHQPTNHHQTIQFIFSRLLVIQ